jgi:hypothetical protein
MNLDKCIHSYTKTDMQTRKTECYGKVINVKVIISKVPCLILDPEASYCD